MSVDYWQILRDTSRTFYLSMRRLPTEIGTSLGLAYLMLRVSDYLEDTETLEPCRKVELLGLWEQVLTGVLPAESLRRELGPPGEGEHDYRAAEAAGTILEWVWSLPGTLRAIILRHVIDSTRGMARWVARGPEIETETDMDDYMHEVAGRVGYLSTEVFAFHSPRVRSRIHTLMPLARETGLALQTVNIIRGLRKDYERGWIYVPRSFCREVGISRRELFDPARSDQAVLVLDRLVSKAERHLQAALSYVLHLPRGLYQIRLACIWPLLFAVRTLAISRGNAKVFEREIKVPRRDIERILRHSTLFGWSNRWIRTYVQTLQQQP